MENFHLDLYTMGLEHEGIVEAEGRLELHKCNLCCSPENLPLFLLIQNNLAQSHFRFETKYVAFWHLAFASFTFISTIAYLGS